MEKLIAVRSKKSTGRSSSKFGGPDNYICVLEVPEGAVVPKHLIRSVLASRGINIIECGEGYSAHTTSPRSMWRQAMQRAIDFCEGVEKYT